MTHSTNNHTGRRVVITGIGLVSPLGIGADAFWANLSAGHSGVRRSEYYAYTAVPGHAAGEVPGFDEASARKAWLGPVKKNVKNMCRDIQLGVASALVALEHAGIPLGNEAASRPVQSERIGVTFGANLMLTPPETLAECARKATVEDPHHFVYQKWGSEGRNAGQPSGMRAMEPLWLLKYLPNMPACHISIPLDARGPSNSITLDESSGNSALGEAARVIVRGDADVMVAGTAGARVHPMQAIHARFWDELAEETGPVAEWCRPFDKHRTGQVIGEGAGTFILEDADHARARGAAVLGELLGFGSSCVLDRRGRPDQRRALAGAMRAALRHAGLEPSDIGHVNAHGLGSRECDRQEAAAILDVFGDAGRTVPVTALKSYTGNAGPGCGTIELAGSLLALRHGLIPPTLNYRTPDPDCPLNIVHGQPQPTDNPLVLNINVTRRGQASAVIARAA